VLERDYYDPLGPEDIAGNQFYRGPDSAGLETNSEYETLQTVQTASLIAGSSLAAIGLGFHIWKWVRKKPPPPVTAASERDGDRSFFSLDAIGVQPTPSGAAVGISGRF